MQKRPGFWQTLRSALAALFGVQREKDHMQDFSSGRPLAYIAAGFLVTLIFIGVLLLLVRIALAWN